ncbi:hypothetical protein [Pengzhenrongella sicca]|uniref:Uncharacterized protein n=1 Tax=Pengzhenrongella sicca TaxID=2819238 RepID=A0A8A4ZK68_9MICO|nr:hypothetical protein [Pengzhenrongella sicca]QTE29988.1 hypothetical protein J4E96_02885 [Pengzhenrongella sicca]
MVEIRSQVVARAVVVTVATLLLAGTLSSCRANAATEAGTDFSAELAEVPGVLSVDPGGNNTLPFTGTADATVELEPGTSDERVGEIVDLIGAYQNEHTTTALTWTSVTVAVGGFALEVVDTRATNGEEMRVFTGLRDDPLLGGARLELNAARDAGGSIGLTAAAGTSFLETLRTGQDLVSSDPFYRDAAVVASSADGLRTVSTRTADGAAGSLDGAIAAYSAVAAQLTVTAAELAPGTAAIRVERYADAAAATALARSAPGAAGVALAVNGGVVTRSGFDDGSGDSSGDASANAAITDALLAATATLDGVEQIVARPASITYTAADLETAQSIAAAIGQAQAKSPAKAPAGTAFAVEIQTPTPQRGQRAFALAAAPADLDDALAFARATSAFGPLEIRTAESAPTAEFTVEAGDTDGLDALLRTVKSMVAAGTTVTLTMTEDTRTSTRVSFEAADQVSIESSLGAERESAVDAAARELVESTWNALPAGR